MSPADDLAVLGRVTLALVVVVGLAILAAKAARRAGVRGGGAGLRVLERAGLTREASVAVVEVAGRALVLGVTPHGVSLLLQLAPEDLESAVGSEDAEAGAEPAIRRIVVPSARVRTPPYGTPPAGGTGSVLDPRTWRQAVEGLRDLTARRR